MPCYGKIVRFSEKLLQTSAVVLVLISMEPKYKYHFKNDFRPFASLSLHEISAFECPPGCILPLKKPDAYALYFVMKGKGVYTLSSEEFSAEKGDIFAIYPGTEIKCRADSKDPWYILSVSFDGVDARRLMNAARFTPKAPLRRLHEQSANNVVHIMAGIYAWRGQEIYSATQSTSLLYALMSMLIKSSGLNRADMPSSWTGTIHLQKALAFIAENYNTPITVKDIAEHVNLSQSRLYRIFLQHIFISPRQYLAEYRVGEGRNMLEKRIGSVKEIAQAVGINDALYFSKLFKQLTGKSPTGYVRELMEWERENNE